MYPNYFPTKEEGWKQKPRQTVVVAFWGKVAAHMLLFRLCSRQVDKRQAGSKMWGGDIFVYYIFNYRSIDFPWNVLWQIPQNPILGCVHCTVLCVCTQYSLLKYSECWLVLLTDSLFETWSKAVLCPAEVFVNGGNLRFQFFIYTVYFRIRMQSAYSFVAYLESAINIGIPKSF